MLEHREDSMLFRLVKGAFKLVLTLAVLAVLAGAYLFYRAMPSYTGREGLPGLSADVRVWRDVYGIPHIFAANMNDAARALGYLHASERLFQMELSRRVGQGRLAELTGADTVGVDKFMRTLGFYAQAQSSYSALSKDAQARLDAYAEGVNAWLKTHQNALPVEFLMTGGTPEAWKPADSLVWLKLMSWQLSRNHAQEIARAKLAAKLSPEQAGWLMPSLSANAPITTLPEAHPDHAALDDPELELSRWLPFRHGASNQWVVAGSHTTTGKPILANDPHLEIGAPSLWYLVRIETPDETLVGASVPGTPIVLLGHNKQIAWGITSSQTDTQDLFVEQVDPANAEQYVTPDGAKPFEMHDETIHVKGGADVKIRTRWTRHGPVMSDVSKEFASVAGSNQVVSLAFTGLSGEDTTFEAILKINAAHNWDEFTDGLKLVFAPMQNIGYADVNGDIGLIAPARVPVRKSGDGLAPANGATGANDWTGWVPFDQLPQVHNPQAGFAFNANNPLVGPDKEMVFGRDWDEPFRARRLQQFFNQIDKHSLETSAQMQADHLSLDAVEFLPLLKAIKPGDERARQALALLSAWDAVFDKDRPEPLIYSAFLLSLHRILIEDRVGVALGDNGPFDAATLLSLIKTHPQWCDDKAAKDAPDPDCVKALSRALDEGLGLLVKRDGADMTHWRWGAEHVAQLTHKIYSHAPLLDRVSDLSMPSSGGFYTLDRGGGYEEPEGKPFARTQGGGFRGLYDLSDLDKSRFIITTGESGHIFSPHYGDLAPLWNDVKSIMISGSEDELKAAGAKELTLGAN
jgi:penicillin G amidase